MIKKVYYRLSKPEIPAFTTEGLEVIPNVTHVHVATYNGDAPNDHIFEELNINIQKAFADRVKVTPDLQHTSMSVGDAILKIDGINEKMVVCDDIGWKELMKKNDTFGDCWK